MMRVTRLGSASARLWLWLGLWLGLFGGRASAQTVELEPAADTTISRDETDESNGKGQNLFVGATNASVLRRGLVRFELAGVPAEARIVSASLRLNASRTIAAAQTLELRPLTEAWGEGTSDASANEGRLTAATAGDATWLMRVFPNTTWTTAGGTFGAAEATLSVSGLGAKTWSSPALAARVQAWLADPGSRHGWLIKNTVETGQATAIRFDTREHPTAANRPKLVVTYELAPVLTDTTAGLDLFTSVFVGGNGRAGFGGPVGGGRLYLDSDIAGALRLGFQRGSGGNLNDIMVLYLDTKAGGEASTAAYTDQGDGSRVAISGLSGTNRSTVTFPVGFRPDFAIAYDPRFGGFLFELVVGGPHRFVKQVAPASTQAAATATFSLSLADLGLAPGDRFGFLGTYLSDTAFRSDEWFGAEVPAGNTGYTPVVLRPASWVVFQTVATSCVPLDCDDDDECTADECTASGCENSPEPRGTECTAGYCDGAVSEPSCVECTLASHCDDDDPCTSDTCVEGACVHADNGTCVADAGPETVEPGPEAAEPDPEPTEPDVEVEDDVDVVEDVDDDGDVVEDDGDVVEDDGDVVEDDGDDAADVVADTEGDTSVSDDVGPVEPGPDVTEPGPDVSEAEGAEAEARPDGGDVELEGGCGGCSGAGGAAMNGLWLLALGFVARRRRLARG